MYQIGDLLWIPAGTLLMRPRVLGRDDLFSNFKKTDHPCLGLFIEHVGGDYCNINVEGQEWSVQTREIRHNVSLEDCYG